MSSHTFNGLGDPTPTTIQTDLQKVAHALRHLIMFSDSAITVLEQFRADHGAAALLSALSPAQETKLRAIWPIVQAAGDAQDPPVSVPDLPAP